MTKEELLTLLKKLEVISLHDKEVAHGEADDALIEYINDPEIKDAYEAIEKWYA